MIKFTNINADGVCCEWWSGEMWVGVTLAVVVEVVPVPLRTSAVAVYMLIISNIGGSMPLLVPVLKTAFQDLGYDPVSSLRGMKPQSSLPNTSYVLVLEIFSVFETLYFLVSFSPKHFSFLLTC